jgi:hypothetical protein
MIILAISNHSCPRFGPYVIVIRHGATPTDQADTDSLHLENVDKQRQITDAGRAQARSIGDACRKLKIPVGAVYMSMFKPPTSGWLSTSGSQKRSASTTRLPVRYLVYIAITALGRVLIELVGAEHRTGTDLLIVAGAILGLSFAVLVLRFASETSDSNERSSD